MSSTKTYKTGFEYVSEWIREYCLSTSQHGYKYIALPGQSMLERSLWILVVLLSIAASVSMVWNQWNKNEHSATITALDTSHYPIWNIDFPAVTICSINRIRKSKAFNLSREWVLPPGMSRDQVFQDILLLSQLSDMNNSNATGLSRLQAVLDLNNITAEEALKSVMIPCEDLFIRCTFKGILKNCDHILTVMKTPYGYCCTFNYHGRKTNSSSLFTWTPSGKRDPYRAERTSACGSQMGLKILIDNHLDEYYDASLASYGSTVVLHNPIEYPSDSMDQKIVGTGNLMMMSVYPVKYQTQQPVRSLDLLKRQCMLRSERDLMDLKMYSYSNCLVECRQNFTIKACGCSPFFYPTIYGQRICNLTDIPCLNDHKFDLLEMGQSFDLEEEFEHVPRRKASNQMPCNCLPECSPVYYQVENSEAELHRLSSDAKNSVEFFEDVQIGREHSLLHVYYIDLVGTRYMRNIYYTWHQQLASVGGVLSLFLGFTIISALEMIYFFTMRVCWCVIRSHQEKRPSIDNDASGPRVATARYLITPEVKRVGLPTRHISFGNHNHATALSIV